MEYIRCNLCGKDNTRLRFTIKSSMYYPKLTNASSKVGPNPPDHFKVVECRNCGLIYVNPRLDFQEETEAHESHVTHSNKTKKSFLLHIMELSRADRFGQRLKIVEKFCNAKKGKMLDVGAAKGEWMEYAQQKGWEVKGLELVPELAKIAKRKKLEIFQGTLEEAHYPSNHFDVVTMTDVIEHVPDPSATTAEMNRILKPGGILLMAAMDISAPIARLSGKYWYYVGGANHIYYFTKKTFNMLLEKEGFKVVHSSIGNKLIRHFIWFPVDMLKNMKNLAFVKLYQLTGSENIKKRLKSVVINYVPTLADHRILIGQKVRQAK